MIQDDARNQIVSKVEGLGIKKVTSSRDGLAEKKPSWRNVRIFIKCYKKAARQGEMKRKMKCVHS